jgi:hypothetical protein
MLITSIRSYSNFSHHLIDFSSDELTKLSGTLFVPVESKRDNTRNTVKILQPTECYFSSSGVSELHSKLFAFVDFGARANLFLAACGTMREPSAEKFAQVLLKEPWRIYDLANGREK